MSNIIKVTLGEVVREGEKFDALKAELVAEKQRADRAEQTLFDKICLWISERLMLESRAEAAEERERVLREAIELYLRDSAECREKGEKGDEYIRNDAETRQVD